jgi:hypothetical protein
MLRKPFRRALTGFPAARPVSTKGHALAGSALMVNAHADAREQPRP